MNADSAAILISQASAIAMPAPAAGPGSAAMVGFRTATSAPVSVRCLVLRLATRVSNDVSVFGALLPMPLTSPPAQNAFPLPVTRIDPTRASSPHCFIMRRNAGVRWSDSAFLASGRFSVMIATLSAISQSSSPVPVSIDCLGIDFDLMLLAKNDVYHTTCTIGQQSKAGYRREPLSKYQKRTGDWSGDDVATHSLS